MRRLLASLAILVLGPASVHAADRTFAIGSFERIRIEGPFEVAVTTGVAPGARVTADQAILDQLDIKVDGTILVVRLGHSGWGETPAKASSRPPVVALATPRLIGATVVAGGKVTVGRMAGRRIDLIVTGAGSLSVAEAEADQLVATVIGNGALSAAGRAASARLSINGTGTIDAPGLTADALIVRVEGNGEISTRARYTAEVTTTGLGKVTVLGDAKCIVRAVAGGPVMCGTAR